MVLKTKCVYCGKVIFVSVPTKNANSDADVCTCKKKKKKNSTARNGIEESPYTECPVTYKLRKLAEKFLIKVW